MLRQFNCPIYRKKPRMDRFSFLNSNFRSIEDRSTEARKMDLVWFEPVALVLDNIPKQVVLYTYAEYWPLPFAHSMRTAKEFSDEGGHKNFEVAQRASKIQAVQSPELDDVFILFGVFHITSDREKLCRFWRVWDVGWISSTGKRFTEMVCGMQQCQSM